ncbi:MAG: MBL fold metallo-hydrolase [Clostridiales Family XIII bacterium]|jgi:7,8-dihydropterin-6-yl-methyl-4-(beta-D-ribofuranosyl)aminobenzene 5'-phosphate synthase|nr:MBL fold metallo-hydrolase [Clostridiales Family XIII bacterium]
MIEITALVENVCEREDLQAEHGLSLFVNKDNRKFLIDTGETRAYLENAAAMDIDLAHIQTCIITHNHIDHIGGLESLLKINPEVKIYLRAEAKSEFYFKYLFAKKQISAKRELFEKYADRFVWIDEAGRNFRVDLENADHRMDEDAYLNKGSNNSSGATLSYDLPGGIHLLPVTVREEQYICKDNLLFEKKDGKLIKDHFDHEQFVVMENAGGLVIVSSCSHNGIVNIIETTKKHFPNKPITHIIAGFHMKKSKGDGLNCSKEFVKETAEALAATGAMVYTCHCTGLAAYEIMQEVLGTQLQYLKTGSAIRL